MATEPVATEPTTESAPTAPRRSLRSPLNLLILGSLFLAATLVSWGIRSRFAHVDTPENSLTEVPNQRVKQSDAAELLARGDNALRQHRHIEARACYRDLLENGLENTAAMHYRLALCDEVFGKVEDATSSYRAAI